MLSDPSCVECNSRDGYYRSGDYSRRAGNVMGTRRVHIHLAPQRPQFAHRKTGVWYLTL